MGFKEKLAGLLSLPKEIVLNLPLVIITGHESVNIENYKNIVEYTDIRIRIKTSCGMLMIEGRGLYLKQITAEHIAVSGDIVNLSYVR